MTHTPTLGRKAKAGGGKEGRLVSYNVAVACRVFSRFVAPRFRSFYNTAEASLLLRTISGDSERLRALAAVRKRSPRGRVAPKTGVKMLDGIRYVKWDTDF